MVHRLAQCCILVSFALSTYTFAADPNTFDPNNAAYWYCKAFAMYEQSGSGEPNMIDQFRRDIQLLRFAKGEIELTPDIEQLLTKSQAIVDLITRGAELEYCNFGFDPFADGKYSTNPYSQKVFPISALLRADIYYQVEHGEGHDYFRKTKTLLRFLSHLDSHELSVCYSTAAGKSVYENIHEYLNNHPDISLDDLYEAKQLFEDESTRNAVSCGDIAADSIATAERLLTDYKVYFSKDRFLLSFPADKLSAGFYARNLDYYRSYMKWYEHYLALPYPQAYAGIKALNEDLTAKARDFYVECKKRAGGSTNDYLDRASAEVFMKKRPFDRAMMLADVPLANFENCSLYYTMLAAPDLSFLSLHTETDTSRNALRAGIDILIQYRLSKALPKSPSASSPKDLFSDKPFSVVKTKNGFKLKCKGADLFKNKVHEYEFTLPNRGQTNN